MQQKRMIKILISGLFILVSWQALATEPIKLGMSAVLTGPSAALGNNMRTGLEAYFNQVNEKGGVQGRQIELIVRDDGYEPERAAVNMRQLIDDDGVLALIGNVGTPTAIVTVPIAEEKKTLLFGAFTGGRVLRTQPASRYVINYRPSYDEETTEIINGLISAGIKPSDISFFTQRDGYGDAVYQGAADALKNHGFSDATSLIHGRYTRNTLNVESAVAAILDAPSPPKAIIMAAGYASSAKFIELVQEYLPEVWFVNLSFVGSHALRVALDKSNGRVIVTQVVPDLGGTLPIVEEFKTALEHYDDKLRPNEVALEGYIVAKIFHQGLLEVRGEINKETIIDGIESIRGYDIGLGTDIYYDYLEHQAMHKVWLNLIEGNNLKGFKWHMLVEE